MDKVRKEQGKCAVLTSVQQKKTFPIVLFDEQ